VGVDDALARDRRHLAVAQRIVRQDQAADEFRMDPGLLQAVLHGGALHRGLARHVAFALAIQLEDAAFAQHDRTGLHFHQQQVAVRGQHHDVDLAVAVAPVVQGVQRHAVEDFEAIRQVVAQPFEDLEFAVAPGVGA